MVNYVKFIRGTVAAFNKLAKKDEDTLYFISETKESESGQLYLGSKLISGKAYISINEIEEFLISNNLANNSILIFDTSLNKWVTKTLPEAIRDSGFTLPLFVGATENSAGSSGLVPPPEAGANGLFLRGDASWANPTEQLELQVNTVEDRVGNLINDLNQIQNNQSILSLHQIQTQELVTNLQSKTTILETKVSNLDNEITALQNNQITMNNLNSLVATQISILAVTKNEFMANVGNLKLLYSYSPFLNDDEQKTIVDDVNDLNDRTKWQKILNN